MKLDAKAEDVVLQALVDAGYKDLWVHTMSRGADTVVLVSRREVERAHIEFGKRVVPKKRKKKPAGDLLNSAAIAGGLS